MSIIPLLASGEHTLPMNKMAPVLRSLIRMIKGWFALNSGGKLTALNVIPVTAAASEPKNNSE